MKLSEYDDEDLIEEIKRRGIKIEVMWHYKNNELSAEKVKIGGVAFDIK